VGPIRVHGRDQPCRGGDHGQHPDGHGSPHHRTPALAVTDRGERPHPTRSVGPPPPVRCARTVILSVPPDVPPGSGRLRVRTVDRGWESRGSQPAPSERFCASVAHSIRRVEHQDSSRERNRNGHQRWVEQIRHRPFSSGSCIAATASTVRPNTTGSASAIRNGSGSLCGVATRREPPSRTCDAASWLTFIPAPRPAPPDPPGCSSSNTVPSFQPFVLACWPWTVCGSRRNTSACADTV